MDSGGERKKKGSFGMFTPSKHGSTGGTLGAESRGFRRERETRRG
jgi:hypothetical protein